MSEKYIIGGGISGLIWNFYHQDFTIITPDVGGNYTRMYMVWLHDCEYTRKLLKDLNLPVKTKHSLIGYYKDGWIADKVDEPINLKLIQKKMTDWDKPLDTSFVPTSKDMSLGGVESVNYMNTLDVDLSEVINRLEAFARIERAFVTKITLDYIETKKDFKSEETKELTYEKLVSTIAAPLFWKAFGEEKDFKYKPITNVITTVKPEEFDDKYEMIYYDDSVKPTRISHLEDKYALEFTGSMTREQFQELYPKLPIEDFFEVKYGRIFDSEDNVSPHEDIVFSGRFASWKYGHSTENIIQEAITTKI